MIKTARQYATTKAQRDRLARVLAESIPAQAPAPSSAGVDPRFLALEQRALESQIADLQAELDAYDALQSGVSTVITVASLADLPTALVQARIARKWTQADLAARLGVAEQQVQRYEATDYESASFARLKEVARVLNVDVPSTVVPNDLAVSPGQFFGRLREVGFDREVVLGKVLPADLADAVREVADVEASALSDAARQAVTRAGTLVSRVLALDPADFFAPGPLRLAPAAAGIRYKRTTTQADRERQEQLRGAEASADAYTVYAHYLALLALEASSHIPPRPVPGDAREVRRILAEEYAAWGGVSLDGVVRFAWDLGIPVLPLSDPGRFHGACWRVAGRNVIVLKQRTRSLARWLVDALHELRHAGQHPDAPDFAVIERDPGVDRSADEVDATRFAGDVVLDGRAEAIAGRAVQAAGKSVERLKRVVPDVAAREGVDADALANYLAFRLSLQGLNWWGAANNLQRPGSDPFGTVRDTFLERADLARVNPLDRQLLLGGLRDLDR